jgi:type I restriction enzyme S subunit
VRQQIRGSASGVKIRHTAPSRIAEVRVRIPPLPIQRRIASILSAYDDLIENNHRRIKILEDMARALYREWFVEFRFPGHESVPLVDSPLGKIPEGWEVKNISGVADVNRTQVQARTAPPQILYIDISSVSPGKIEAVTRYEFKDAPGRARRVVQHGDVLWSCVRPNRRSHAPVMYPEEDTVASTGFAVLTATEVPYVFLYYATTTDDFVGYLTNHATGAAYPAVTAQTFSGARILVPDQERLLKFAEYVTPTAEEIHNLQSKNQNLRRTRDLLLPRLLSGQLDVTKKALQEQELAA